MDTVPLPANPIAIAPDGAEVRALAGGERSGLAHFTLAAGQVSVAVGHETVEELWHFVAGTGEMWRRPLGAPGDGVVVSVEPGVSLRIPPRTEFQFRATGDAALEAVGATMPPWPGQGEDMTGRGEIFFANGPWEPTVRSGLDPGAG